MKFELKEYNPRNIFLDKLFTKCGGKTIPTPFSRKSESLDQLCKVFCSLFMLYPKLKAMEIYWNYAADQLLLPQIKFFKNTKRGLGLVFLPHFLDDF